MKNKFIKNNAYTVIFCLLFILTMPFLLCGCLKPNMYNFHTYTDCLGRKVDVPDKVERIVCLGAGALRMVSYAGAEDKVCGIEDIELDYNETLIQRPYSYTNHELFSKLNSKETRIGNGGGRGNTARAETLAMLNPDVVFCSYTPDALKQIYEKTKLPIVSIFYDANFMDKNLIYSMQLLGKILNKQDKCNSIIETINCNIKNLNERTKNIENKKKVYVGGVSYSGAHGFDWTYSNYSPLDAINAVNVADNDKKSGGYQVSLENNIQDWQPDVVFVETTNYNLVLNDYNDPNKRKVMNSINAIQNNDIYTVVSYNWYSTNIELAIANAYFMGKTLYPEQFSDIDIIDKTNDLVEKFLGAKNYYSELEKHGLKFERKYMYEK